jgi:2-keto-4-pentenoate hydratase/2-oxohepta-3-ene-1,7-dioic acid hydratase in catechol pathway
MQLATCIFEGAIHSASLVDGELALMPSGSGGILDLVHDVERLVPFRTVALDEVIFLPPIPNPSKILCVGLNYHDHAREGAADVPAHPALFIRFPDSIVGHRRDVIAPAVSSQFDYEAELAVVIGKPCWRLTPEQAADCVAGYACFAENSARDFQFHSRQVTAGKNFPSSGAFGPWLTTADEVGDLSARTLTGRLNGAVMQQARLGELIYDVPTCVSYISQFTRLMPGDVIATGTPAGVGGARQPPIWLRPGDVFEVEISGIGCLSNSIVAESANSNDILAGR